ncbi:unnamed protein product [Rotaria sp. Silwood2]|nr:unnamed protein product [Rotaria sp. Silwood2]
MEGGDNSLYRVLNKTLRSENRREVVPWFGFLKLFDTALSKLPAVQECVWRGVAGDISQQFKEGDKLTWWSISSCSVSLKVVQDFLGSEENATLFMIEVKNAKNINGYTNYPDEQEVLLRPGTQLRVKDNALHHKGGLHVVHLAEVCDGHEAQLPNAMASLNLSSKSENKSASKNEHSASASASASASISTPQATKKQSSSNSSETDPSSNMPAYNYVFVK